MDEMNIINVMYIIPVPFSCDNSGYGCRYKQFAAVSISPTFPTTRPTSTTSVHNGTHPHYQTGTDHQS